MADFQKTRSNEPSPRCTAEYETDESQSIEIDGIPSVKRLDGEVMRLGEIACTGGKNCEVWVGQWEKKDEKRVSEEVVGGRTGVEKVSPSLTARALLIRFFAGGSESVSNTQIIGERVEGLAFTDHLYAVRSRLRPRSSGVRTRTAELG